MRFVGRLRSNRCYFITPYRTSESSEISQVVLSVISPGARVPPLRWLRSSVRQAWPGASRGAPSQVASTICISSSAIRCGVGSPSTHTAQNFISSSFGHDHSVNSTYGTASVKSRPQRPHVFVASGLLMSSSETEADGGYGPPRRRCAHAASIAVGGRASPKPAAQTL